MVLKRENFCKFCQTKINRLLVAESVCLSCSVHQKIYSAVIEAADTLKTNKRSKKYWLKPMKLLLQKLNQEMPDNPIPINDNI